MTPTPVGSGNREPSASIFFGADAATFYSALGWGNSALTASLVIYWSGAAGIALLRRQRAHAEEPLRPPSYAHL